MNGRPLSSEILSAISSGDIALANDLLGTHYTLRGIVVHGNHLGRQIGFPTANIELSKESAPLPGIGVYAVKVTVQHEVFPGMANIGYRPTIDGHQLTFEVHIIDFSRNLYDLQISISFFQRIRDEIKFPDLDTLKAQLNHDKQHVKALFS